MFPHAPYIYSSFHPTPSHFNFHLIGHILRWICTDTTRLLFFCSVCYVIRAEILLSIVSCPRVTNKQFLADLFLLLQGWRSVSLKRWSIHTFLASTTSDLFSFLRPISSSPTTSFRAHLCWTSVTLFSLRNDYRNGLKFFSSKMVVAIRNQTRQLLAHPLCCTLGLSLANLVHSHCRNGIAPTSPLSSNPELVWNPVLLD